MTAFAQALPKANKFGIWAETGIIDMAVTRPASNVQKRSPARTSAITATGGSRRFKVSRAYSVFVQSMKLILPFIALLLIVAILIWPHLRADSRSFSIGFSNIELSEAKDPSMINARYIGTDNENQPFSITADIARKTEDETQSILLELPQADLTLTDGTWLVLRAQSGLYDRPTSYLELDGVVNLFHDSGYEMHTETAGIDLANGSAEGHSAVYGQGPFGRINSEGFRLIDKGKTIIFTGKTEAKLFLNRTSTP